MSYDEEEQRRSRVVMETPTARREVVQTQTTRVPEKTGYSTGVVAAVALTAIAATAILFLFLTNREDEPTNTNVRVATTAPTPIPTQPTPIIIQQAPPVTTQPAPVIITQPPTTTTVPPTTAPPTVTTAPSGSDDVSAQAKVSEKFQDDADLSTTDVIATVINGKATLTGRVKTQDLKRRAERLALSVKGVRTVDNQIIVQGSGTLP
jgi:hypothetical protein